MASLFTSVPTDKVKNFIGRKIDSGEITLPITKDQFFSLFDICVQNNYFRFKEEFFRQKHGISMGSPLSPVLANIFMEFFESELMPAIPIQPTFYARYVDDVIIFWPDDQDFGTFFAHINNLVPSIKFSTEWEQNACIPFLDMRISRLTSGFSFGIYRKPTHSNQYIHYFSSQPDHVKRGSVFSLLLRAYRLCDQIYRDEEVNFIFESFRKVGFPTHILQEVHSKVKAQFYRKKPVLPESGTPDSPENKHKPTICLPHNNFIQQYAKPVFQANQFQLVNKADNTLKNSLVFNKPPLSEDRSAVAGVYSVPCVDCSSHYYGETGRGLSVRLNEHKCAVNRKDTNNAFYKHQKETFEKQGKAHDIDWEGAKMLHSSHNWNHRLIIESSLIKSFHNFNGMSSTLGIDNYSAKLVLDSIPNLQQ